MIDAAMSNLAIALQMSFLDVADGYLIDPVTARQLLKMAWQRAA
jgi:proteasome assembly chaperone (PAC2) family protein